MPTVNLTLREIQAEIAIWSRKNFGSQQSKRTLQILGSGAPLLGIVEELGELAHAELKSHQGIRGFDCKTTMGAVKFMNAQSDAAADILIYLCDYAAREGIDLLEVLNKTWTGVKERNWTENPEKADKPNV